LALFELLASCYTRATTILIRITTLAKA
jgi:hypothetical protein